MSISKTCWFRSLTALGVVAMLAVSRAAAAQQDCFERLDNGVDLTGWHPSATNHHGPGSAWVVENGAFTGRQTAGQQGGILMTEQSYSDVEVVFEVKIPWGCDSGFFFRTTAGDRAYQACIDHLLPSSSVGSIYGEGFAENLLIMPYTLDNGGNTAVPVSGQTAPFDLAMWSTIWKPAEFNEMRARIEGNPPHMQIWISDMKVVDYTDTKLRGEIEASGPLAIQVHSGGRWTADGAVQFRNIRVRDLTQDCTPMEPGGGGSAGQAGAGGAAGASGSVGGSGSGASGGGGAPAGVTGGGGVSSAGAPSGAGVPGSGGSSAPNGTSTQSTEQDSGCGVAARGQGSGAGWLLLLGLGLRRRLTARRAC
jgi:hypothetical protein